MQLAIRKLHECGVLIVVYFLQHAFNFTVHEERRQALWSQRHKHTFYIAALYI